MKFEELLVIETGPGLAGPLVTRTLRDFGARVIKIESAARLDFGKTRVPPPGKTARDMALAPSVMEMNGAKESVALNLKTDEGRQIFTDLLAVADVYVESYAPGWLERLGLSLELFQQRNPGLVILSQSAYGSSGPKSDQRAYAPIMTALGGLESTVGYADGRVISQVSSAVGDLVAAYFGNLLVLSALHERERTGYGAILDMSQTEASIAIAGVAFAEFALTGTSPGPLGNSHPSMAPHGMYKVAGDDQWVAIAIGTDEEWRRLAAALDIDDETTDRFQHHSTRLAHRDQLDGLLGDRLRDRNRETLCAALQAAGVPCTPLLDVYEADRYPHLVERGLWTAFEHPEIGELRMTEIPWRFDSLELQRRGWAEELGESTDTVLREILHVTDDEILRWREAGALA